MLQRVLKTVLVAASLTAAIPAFADVLNTVGSVEITSGNIAFYPLGGTSGTFVVGPPDTGMFAGLAVTTGTIMDLNSTAEPINTQVNVPNFMTFAAAPNLSFTLTELLGGTQGACPGPPPAPGQSCTPTGTPYNLNNLTANSSSAGFTVNGYVVDTNHPGTQTSFSGLFTTQFANESLQQVIQTIETGGKLDATFSAQFIATPTPEPGTIFTLCGGGLLMLGMRAFRKRNPASKSV